MPIVPRTFAYGRTFEHFVICELVRLNAYLRRDFKFSYLKTKDGAEIDLIIERPGAPAVLVEIKSASEINETDASVLRRFIGDFPNSDFRIWSNDPRAKRFGEVLALPWLDGMEEVLGT